MKDNEINIAIAEACGWHHIIKDDEWGPDRALKPDQKFKLGCAFTNIPDYCNDLTAMHEAEKVVADQSKEHDYWFFVRQIIGFSDAQADWDEVDHFKAIHATARQRAEAFLRTLGKWKD